MSEVRHKDTTPEKKIRKIVHKMGYRFRLNNRHIPGTPDLAFPKLKKVIFIHGCFWHRHNCKKGRSMPAVRQKFWKEKFRINVERDVRTLKALSQTSWKPFIVWECEPEKKTTEKIRRFLES